MSALRYSIIGTGAVGGYYGGTLAHAGFDVHFLVHSDYTHIKKYGLRVDSINGDMVINPASVYENYLDLPDTDVICVCLKATQNYLLAEILPHLYKSGATVLLMQNGLGGEELVRSIIPEAHVMGGLCFICSNKLGPGHIHHMDYGAITLGEHYSQIPLTQSSKKFKSIVDDFKKAHIDIKVSDDLRLARWKKLVWNMPFNGLSVLFGTTREMMDTSESRVWALEIMQETVAAAQANGVNISPTFIDEMMQSTDVMKPYKPSMMLDYGNSRPMELDFIYKYPIDKGLERGLKMDRTRELYLRLLELDKKNRAS